MTPTRLLDMRIGVGVPARAVAAHVTLGLRVLGVAPVPAHGVSTVFLSLVATASTATGYIAALADVYGRPPTSALNFTRGTTNSNFVPVAVPADGIDLHLG